MPDTREPASRALNGTLKFLARMVGFFAFLLTSFSTHSAQAQSTRSDPQNPLQIVHPFETIADFQRQLDQLEAESKKVDTLLNAAGNRIFIQLDQSVNSAGNAGAATLGAVFVNRADYEEIRKTAAEAVAAAKDAATAFEQARTAYQSGQTNQAITKAAEAADLAQKSGTKLHDVYSQTEAVFNRIITEGRVVTGTATPEQAKELAKDLAKRFWDTRPEFAKAAKDLSELGQAMDDHEVLINLKGSINSQIAKLTNLITQASLAPPAPALPLPPDGPPPGIDPNTPPGTAPPAGTNPNAPPGTGLPLTGTDPNLPPGGAQPPSGTDPNTPPGAAPPSTGTDPGTSTVPPGGTDRSMPPGSDPNAPSNVPPDAGPKTPNTTSSNGWCNGDLALCGAWRDGGDRAAFGDPANSDPVATAAANAARQQFYDQNPQLKQFQDTAAFMSPATEVNSAIQNGQLGNTTGDTAANSGQSSSLDMNNPSAPAKLDDGSSNSPGNTSASLNGPDSNPPEKLDDGSSVPNVTLNPQLPGPDQLYQPNYATRAEIGQAQAERDAARAQARAERDAARNSFTDSGDGRSFWDKLVPWLQFAGQVAQTVDQIEQQQRYQNYLRYQAQQAQLAQQRALEAQRQAQQRALTNPTKPGTAPKPGTTAPPVPGQQPKVGQQGSPTPGPNCSSGICCPYPQIPNPAAIACLNAPLFINGQPNTCDHVGQQPGSAVTGHPFQGYVSFCILPGH